jgi:hypothetical protein
MKNSLTDTRISELENLGFVWKAALSADESWKKRVHELVAYRDTNGHCRVPLRYEPNMALGRWVIKLRSQYTCRGRGMKTALTDTRISELDGLGFVWKAGTKTGQHLSADESWKKRVHELVAYRDTNGHCRVPSLYEPNKALGWWLERVRTQYKWRGQGKKTTLTDAHISELDGLGFVWKAVTKKKIGLVGNELWKKGEQNISGLSACQEKPLNSIDQDAAPHNRTISPPAVPLAGAPRNVLPQSSTAILQTNNQISLNPSPASNAGLNALSPVLPQSSTGMLQTSNQISPNLSRASNAGFKESKQISCLDGMEAMLY